MLKTNTKQVSNKVENYIISNFKNLQQEQPEYKYDHLHTIASVNADNYAEVCNAINYIFFCELLEHDCRWNAGRLTRYDAFTEWCQGLPAALNCKYYLHSACDLLGEWLEETEEEKKKFTERQAEEKITYLLYREINRHATRTGILY